MRSHLLLVLFGTLLIGCNQTGNSSTEKSASVRESLQQYMIKKFQKGLVGVQPEGIRWRIISADVKKSDSLLLPNECPLEGLVYLNDQLDEKVKTTYRVKRRAFLVPVLKFWEDGNFDNCYWEIQKIENEDKDTMKWFDNKGRQFDVETMKSLKRAFEFIETGMKNSAVRPT